jgi:hypothetical protein
VSELTPEQEQQTKINMQFIALVKQGVLLALQEWEGRKTDLANQAASVGHQIQLIDQAHTRKNR